MSDKIVNIMAHVMTEIQRDGMSIVTAMRLERVDDLHKWTSDFGSYEEIATGEYVRLHIAFREWIYGGIVLEESMLRYHLDDFDKQLLKLGYLDSIPF